MRSQRNLPSTGSLLPNQQILERTLDNKQSLSSGTKNWERPAVSARGNGDRHEPWWLRHRGASAGRAHIANARGVRLWRRKAAALYRGIAILALNAVVFAPGLECWQGAA